MATGISARRSRAQRTRPTGTFELHAWFFMRVTGLALVVLALTHWTIMHFINRLAVENSAWIVNRYQNVLWPTFDATMLLFAMLHGTNGLRYIIDDYLHGRTINMLAKGLLYAVSAIFILLGLITIFMLPHTKVQ
ncbi:MAG TPA: succinate dehydrogenase [Armatimonadota bacterium]|jgi:succinate dehydrogenase / fumarate reductase membrane anchor subunit